MRKTGILIHVYNVEDPAWEQIAWGDPATNALGSLPKLCELILTEATENPITTIVIYSGPSHKDGLGEGAYTKQFLLTHLENLAQFPTLQPLLNGSPDTLPRLRSRLEKIILGKDLIRTSDEIAAAAELFQPPEIQNVIQIACASHAARCMQTQVIAREKGQIADGQIWSVIATNTDFAGLSAQKDVVVFEKPHLPQDPMLGFEPCAPAVLGQYFSLSTEVKRAFLIQSDEFMRTHLSR